MRPIDADDVIERLDMICDAGGCLSPVTKAVRSFCKGLINHQPTIEAEPDNGWISVKDKMPDECQEVLIYCPEFLEEIRKAFYTEGDFYVDKEDLIVKPAPNGYCTHWQPLPEPPKENISREESDEQLYGGYEEDRKTMIGSNE